MLANPPMQLSDTEPVYKIGTYFVNKKHLYHINYITNDFILLEDCYNNIVESWQIESFLRASKRIVRKEVKSA